MQPGVNDFVIHPAGEAEAGPVCAICQTAIQAAEPIGPCPSCASTFHGECWTENGGCAVYGCDRMPKTVKEESASPAPQSYWGQEEKTCPNCAEKIKIAATRCRHCGTTFDTAVPMSSRELREKKRIAPERDSLKKSCVTLFVCGIVPFLAPFALLFGGFWFLRRRRDIMKLPGTHRVMCCVGLIASVLCTGLFILLLLLT